MKLMILLSGIGMIAASQASAQAVSPQPPAPATAATQVAEQPLSSAAEHAIAAPQHPLTDYSVKPGAFALGPLGTVENSYVQLNLGSGFSGRSDLGLDIGNGGSERTSQGLRPGFAGSALIGDSYTSGISIEAEGLYFTNNLDDAHSGATSNGGDAHAQGGGGFANLKYEHVNASPVFPYVAVGLGYGQVQYDVFNGTGASDGLMWQLKAGLAFPVSERFTWDVGYRFVRMQQYSTTSDVNIGGQNYIETFKSATQLLMLSAGARWSF